MRISDDCGYEWRGSQKTVTGNDHIGDVNKMGEDAQQTERKSKMDIDAYQIQALRTANLDKMEPSEALLNAVLGLNGEAGEIADMLKKARFQGHELDQGAMEKEVGDVLWYCALAASAMGTSLSAIAEKNIKKLYERYPNGFEPERSIHREEAPNG